MESSHEYLNMNKKPDCKLDWLILNLKHCELKGILKIVKTKIVILKINTFKT